MSPQEAIVAVAKSLLAVIHAVLRSGQPYRERDAVLLERAGAAEAGSTPRTSVAPTGGGAGEVCRGCGTDAESGSERGCGTKPRRTERRRRNGCSPTEAGLAEESATRRTVESEEPTKSISLPGSRSKVCRGKPGFRARQTKNQYSDARESPWRGYSADSAENRDTPAQRRKRKKSNAEPSTRARSRRNIFEAKGRT
jgi:hypothetical protein